MSSEIEQAVKNFTETSKIHLHQEINGCVDQELSRTYYKTAKALVLASKEHLESNMSDELEDLEKKLIPLESEIGSAQVLNKGLVTFFGAVGMAFAIGFSNQLGVNFANDVYNPLRKLQDPEGEHMKSLLELQKKLKGKVGSTYAE